MAGNDIILCPLDVPKAVDLIEQAILAGKVSQADVDARVLKILKAKEWAGCHQFKKINKNNIATKLITTLGKQLKQKLYEQAVTVMPDRGFMPIMARDLRTTAVVAISGQSGEFKKQLGKEVGAYWASSAYFEQPAVMHSNAKLLAQLAPYETVVIAIFGMNKFAAQQYGIATSTQELIAALQAAGKNVIYVLFGTPYSVALLDKNSPIIIAYEDDLDAQRAAAEILLGRRQALGICPVITSASFASL